MALWPLACVRRVRHNSASLAVGVAVCVCVFVCCASILSFVEQMRSKQAAWAPIRRRCSAVAEFASQLSSGAACTCVYFECSFEMVASAAFPSVALSYSMARLWPLLHKHTLRAIVESSTREHRKMRCIHGRLHPYKLARQTDYS